MTTDNNNILMKCYMISKILYIHLYECMCYIKKSLKRMANEISDEI